MKKNPKLSKDLQLLNKKRNLKTKSQDYNSLKESTRHLANKLYFDYGPLRDIDEVWLGKRKGILKASRLDLPVIYAKKLWAATTVAATMIIAAQAGIELFVTGGIGGVHRGASETMDISSDLQELAKTNVTVICAGAKAILDLPLTMELRVSFKLLIFLFNFFKVFISNKEIEILLISLS